MGTEFDNLQQRLWRKQQRELMEEYEAVQTQIGMTLEAAQKLRLERQAARLTTEIQALDEKLKGTTAVDPPNPHPNTQTDPQNPHLVALTDGIVQAFDLAELKDLYFRLNIDHENIAADTKPELARALVRLLHRHGRLADLVALLERLRPNRRWVSN